MDDVSLNSLLNNASRRQFWLKPWGVSEEPELQGHGELFPEREIEIPFARQPNAIAEGDILISWRVGAGLIFVAERLPGGPFATSKTFPAGVTERFPFSYKVRNLTPTFGNVWPRYDLRPFSSTALVNKV